VLVALSGGVDSSVLTALAAQELGPRAVALTVLSPVYPQEELEAAAKVAQTVGLRHLQITVDHLAEIPGFADNPLERCYLCKRFLFGRMRELAAQEGLTVVHGEQADDLQEPRLGRKAAAEMGVRAPLAEAGLRKAEIRLLAQRLGLPVAAAPPRACLATRFPVGFPLTHENLARVAAAEEALARLGFTNYRARCHGELVRLEVPPAEVARLTTEPVRSQLIAELRRLGFRYITADLVGYPGQTGKGPENAHEQ
jgi:uncharacterized protein